MYNPNNIDPLSGAADAVPDKSGIADSFAITRQTNERKQ